MIISLQLDTKKYNNNDIIAYLKKEMGRSDPESGTRWLGQKMGRIVPDEMTWYEMVFARQVPEPQAGVTMYIVHTEPASNPVNYCSPVHKPAQGVTPCARGNPVNRTAHMSVLKHRSGFYTFWRR